MLRDRWLILLAGLIVCTLFYNQFGNTVAETSLTGMVTSERGMAGERAGDGPAEDAAVPVRGLPFAAAGDVQPV